MVTVYLSWIVAPAIHVTSGYSNYNPYTPYRRYNHNNIHREVVTLMYNSKFFNWLVHIVVLSTMGGIDVIWNSQFLASRKGSFSMHDLLNKITIILKWINLTFLAFSSNQFWTPLIKTPHFIFNTYAIDHNHQYFPLSTWLYSIIVCTQGWHPSAHIQTSYIVYNFKE